MSRFITYFLLAFINICAFVLSAFAGEITSRYDVNTSQFTLDASDVISKNQGELTYSWIVITSPPGSSAFIASPNDPIVSFAADISGEYSVELQVTDAGVPLAPTKINLSTDASNPVADFAVLGRPEVGSSIELNGLGSHHPDSLALSYEWQILSAPVGSASSIDTASLGANGFSRTFTPDVEGEYEIELTVTDLTGNFNRITRTFVTGQAIPVAEAGGDRSVEVGQSIFLDPFESTYPNLDSTSGEANLLATWSVLHKPIASTVELAGLVEGRQPFAADVAGLYVIQLEVQGNDGVDRDTIVISAGDSDERNVAPVSRIDALREDGASIATGPAIIAGETLTLSGVASSDDDGNQLTYRWALVSAPDGSSPSLSSTNGPQISFETDLQGEYVVSLSVDDNALSHTSTILLSSSPLGPIANAGPDIILPDDRIVNVDANGSLINDGASTSYSWSVLGLGTEGASQRAQINNPIDISTSISFSDDSNLDEISGRNLITNGSFETHGPLTRSRGRWDSFETIEGWTSPVGLIEVQESNFQTGNRNNNAVVELDANFNSTIATTVNVETAGQYIFSIDYAMRRTDPDTNGFIVKVDGNEVATVAPNRFGFQTLELVLDLEEGQHEVQLAASGRSDSIGTVIDNISLVRNLPFTLGEELVLNGSFETHPQLPRRGWKQFETIEGWASSVGLIEVQERNFQTGNQIDNAVIELDARSNSRISQTVQIASTGAYQLSFDYAIRRTDLTTNGVAVLVDGEIVRLVTPGSSGFLSSEVTLELTNGSHEISFAALGRSDSIGTVIDNVSLRQMLPTPVELSEIDIFVAQVSVSDENGTSVDTVLATNGNIAPVASIVASQSNADIGTAITLNAASSIDANNDSLSFRWALLSKPEGSETELVISTNGETVTIIPDTRGAYVAQLIAIDEDLESNPTTFIVFGNNQAPQISSVPILDGVVGVGYEYQAAATDLDGDTLNWSLIAGPQGASINSATGLVTLTPLEPGSQAIEIAVADDFGGQDTQTYTIEVEDPRNLLPPVITVPDTFTIRPGELVTFSVTATDPEDDAISFQALPLPNGAQFNTQTGEFTFTAGDELGLNRIEFFATDGVLTSSAFSMIEVVAWPDTDPTRLSGRVLDAADFANGIETPVIGATATIAGTTVSTDASGAFSFETLTTLGLSAISINGATATAADGSIYGTVSESRIIYENGENVLTTPILLARLGDEEVQLTDVNDDLPPELRSCRIQRVDSLSGGSVPLSIVPLQAFDSLVPGSTAVVWSRGGSNVNYVLVGEGVVAADGVTLENVTGSVGAGSNLIVTALPVTTQGSDLQANSRLHPTVLGEGNMQTSFALPSYSTLSQQRAPSFIYNSTAADPRPIITANVELPANSTLTQNLQVEVFVNGQRMPGVGVVNISRSEIDGSTIPVQGTTARTSISVAFNASSIPTGVYPYELLVFAEHECAAAAAKAEGNIFINNRSESVYGAGWKPTELQEIIELPDGSIAIEEPDGTITHFENAAEGLDPFIRFDLVGGVQNTVSDFNNDGLLDIAATNEEDGRVRIFINQGDRDFLEGASILAGRAGAVPQVGLLTPSLTNLTSGDVNNDGNIDLVVSRQQDAPHDGNLRGIAVAFGNGDGTFADALVPSDPAFQAADFNFDSVAVVDFNLDGVTDVVGIDSRNAIPFLQQADGSFVRSANVRLNDRQGSVRPVDIDQDGIQDLIFNDLSAILIKPTGNVLVTSRLPSLFRVLELNASFFDEASQTFYAASVGSTRDGIQLNVARFNSTANTFELVFTHVFDEQISEPRGLEFINLNDDGAPEIVVGDLNNPTVFQLTNNGDFTFQDPEPVFLGHQLLTTSLGDLDNDGLEDLISVTRFALFVDFRGRQLARPFGDFTDLVRNDDGTFSRRYKDGTAVVFNAQGQQTSVTDSNGNVTSYTYDANGGVSSITDPTGEVSTYTYDSGRLASVTTPDGRVNTFEYDALGNLVTASQPNISLPQTAIGPDGSPITVGVDADSNVVYPERAYRTGNSTVSFAYDANGRIIGQVDERGFQTTNTYGPAGRLTNTNLPDGGNVRLDIAKTLGLSEFGVDLDAPVTGTFVAPEDRVTVLEDARGNRALKLVNEFGAVIETLDPVGRTTVYERDENNLVTRVDAPSNVTDNGRLFTDLAYDVQGNVTSKREAVGTPNEREMVYEYEPEFSQITRMVDYEGFEWNHTYDDRANRLTTTNPDGTVMSYTYNDQGQVLTKTDERGNIMAYAYDELGRAIVMTDERGIDMTYTRDGSGNPSVVVEANGEPEVQATINLFDERNRKIVSINGEDEAMQYSYDNFGNQRVTTDATGVENDMVYDEKSRVAFVDDAASGRTSIDYDLTDNITQVVESDGTTSTMVYDEVNRVTESTDGINVTRRYVYDERDNIIATTDGRGNTTTFTYDELDRLIARTNQVGNTWAFEYDLRNLRTATIKPDGTRIEFTYDNRSRLISYGAVGNTESLRTFAYDEEDNLISATAANSTDNEIAHAFTYDERDQLSQAALAAGPLGNAFSFEYEYDALQRRSVMRDSAGGVTRYAYDLADRLISVEVPSGRIVDITYDDASRRANVAMPNGLNARSAFSTPAGNGETTGLLTSIDHGLDNAGATGSSLNELLGTFTYGYNQKANITAINESGTVGRTRNYTLDPIERLLDVSDATGTSLENYTLDDEGNRITSHLASFHVTNPANRVTEDEAHQFEYDVNGNLVRKTNTQTGATSTYTYSVYDELISVTQDTGTIAYVYDAMGRRHTERKTDNVGSSSGGANFRYDGQHLAVEQVLDDQEATSGGGYKV